jgi:DNA polymerase-3 subunit epsilon
MFSLTSPSWDAPVYWALDLETSGLDPQKDVILSVGMVPIRQGVIHWGERFYSLVRPRSGHQPAEAAIRIHHILPRELAQAPGLDEVLQEILGRLMDSVLLVHYAKLDIGFLRRACPRQGQIWPRPRVVDTVKLLGRLSHRRRQLSPYAEPLPTDLSKARESLSLPPHEAHHALHDALATAELFLALRSALEARKLRQLT